MNLYHITSRKAWIEATRNGLYTAPSLSSEGFIHCSTAAQILPVARHFYRGQAGLVLMVIDPKRLNCVVKWESAAADTPLEGVRQDASFPHLYGPIAMEAVVQVLDFEPGVDGEFVLPSLPAETDSLEAKPLNPDTSR